MFCDFNAGIVTLFGLYNRDKMRPQVRELKLFLLFLELFGSGPSVNRNVQLVSLEERRLAAFVRPAPLTVRCVETPAWHREAAASD